MLMSTTTVIEGRPVSRYLGVVTGEAIIGANTVFHQGQPSSETKIASTKYVYVPPLLASSISYRPSWAGTLIQNVLD